MVHGMDLKMEAQKVEMLEVSSDVMWDKGLVRLLAVLWVVRWGEWMAEQKVDYSVHYWVAWSVDLMVAEMGWSLAKKRVVRKVGRKVELLVVSMDERSADE